MFLDEVRITVASGAGGNGAVHFRREKYVPRGGPDGGDGGRGGDVILQVSRHLNTLSSFRQQRQFQAEDGKHGQRANRYGRSGENLVIQVPPGTIVRIAGSQALLGDLVEPEQQLVVCKGGRGGRGNAKYATARNQAPRMAEKGEPGVALELHLELRLIADIGLVGLPNAGKSTLLAAVTGAKPKIAPYPFTTLEPNLGVAELDDHVTLVIADIPGLIEGAHLGVGLGFDFLRHIQRTRVIIHLLDGSSADPLADLSQINSELSLFDEQLGRKPQVVAINKIDLPEAAENWPLMREQLKKRGLRAFAMSGLTRQGVREVLFAAYHALQELPEPKVIDEPPVYRLEEDPDIYEIVREDDGGYRVVGVAIERAASMTYWEYDEAVRRFMRLLEHLGVEGELREAGATNGDTVRIGEIEFEWQD